MTIEIHTPELEQRVKRRLQNGRFHDVDELFTKALDALEKEEPHEEANSSFGLSGKKDWRKMRGMARGKESLTQALIEERTAE